MTMLSELLQQARDIGLHVLLARSASGAGRAMFEPVIQRTREMGSPGLVMSGSKDEGPSLGGVRPAALPAGRGYLVERRAGSRLVQTALVDSGARGYPPPPRQRRQRPAGITRTTAVASSTSPSAAPTMASATVRGRMSGGGAGDRHGRAGVVEPPASCGITAVTACTGFTRPWPVPVPRCRQRWQRYATTWRRACPGHPRGPTRPPRRRTRSQSWCRPRPRVRVGCGGVRAATDTRARYGDRVLVSENNASEPSGPIAPTDGTPGRRPGRTGLAVVALSLPAAATRPLFVGLGELDGGTEGGRVGVRQRQVDDAGAEVNRVEMVVVVIPRVSVSASVILIESTRPAARSR